VNKRQTNRIDALVAVKTHQVKVSELVASFSAAAQSNATTRSYGTDISHFEQYGGTIPATPEVVAEYLASFATSLSRATLQHRLVAIHRAHVDNGLTSPAKNQLVKRTMQGIRRTLGTKQRRVAPLMKEDMFEMVVHVERQRPVRAARDKALLLIGFAGAFRRSELVALTVEDITKYETGIELAIRRSKTDQEGVGRTVFIPYARGKRCPVKALFDWIDIAAIISGSIFLRVSRNDRVTGSTALSPQTVALVLKSYVSNAR
jgi:site-specific recombinase XerD